MESAANGVGSLSNAVRFFVRCRNEAISDVRPASSIAMGEGAPSPEKGDATRRRWIVESNGEFVLSMRGGISP
jgi:hypothetical protein